jgi:hypothetical protein
MSALCPYGGDAVETGMRVTTAQACRKDFWRRSQSDVNSRQFERVRRRTKVSPRPLRTSVTATETSQGDVAGRRRYPHPAWHRRAELNTFLFVSLLDAHAVGAIAVPNDDVLHMPVGYNGNSSFEGSYHLRGCTA